VPVIWLAIVPLVLAVFVGVVLCLGAQSGHRAYVARRDERRRIEREKRWAERRLHDIASQAFSSLTEELRRSQTQSDVPWSA
jgi:hypothetical protein